MAGTTPLLFAFALLCVGVVYWHSGVQLQTPTSALPSKMRAISALSRTQIPASAARPRRLNLREISREAPGHVTGAACWTETRSGLGRSVVVRSAQSGPGESDDEEYYTYTDSDEWESDEDLSSPVYVDRDGKKMTEEEYYFKVLGKPMPKNADEGAPSSTPSKDGKERKKSKAGKKTAVATAPAPPGRRVNPYRSMNRLERILDGTERKAFKRLTLARYACKEFKKQPVPASLIKEVLAMTMRAPSSFNVQPYKILIIRDEQLKLRLSAAMMDLNKQKILTAGVTAIFLADKDPMQKMPTLEKQVPETAIEAPRYIRLFGERINTPYEWAMKNTMIAASFYLMGATSMGLATAPIEGFKEDIILQQLGIPKERYGIPIIIPTGYARGMGRFTRRLKPTEMCYFDSLDQPIDGIRPVTDSSLVE